MPRVNNRAAGLAQAAQGLYQISDSFMNWEDRNRSRQYMEDKNRQQADATAAKEGMNYQNNMTDLAIADQKSQTDLEVENRRGENALAVEDRKGQNDLSTAQAKSQGDLELEKAKNAFMVQKDRATRFMKEIEGLNQQADRLAFQIAQMPNEDPRKKQAVSGYNQLKNQINMLTESELEAYDDSANYISQFTPTPVGGDVTRAVLDQPSIDKYHQTRAQITETLRALGSEDVMGDYQFMTPNLSEREKMQMEGNQKLAGIAMQNAGQLADTATYGEFGEVKSKAQLPRSDASKWVTQALLLNESYPPNARQTQAAPDEGTPVFTQSGSNGKAITQDKMWEYLVSANYDVEYAKTLAKQDGYDPDNIQ